MSWYSDEERDARRDFERRGRYGYDHERYNNHSDDADMAYTRAFDEVRQRDDRDKERRAQENEEGWNEFYLTNKRQFEQEESEPYIPPNNNVNYNNVTDDLPF